MPGAAGAGRRRADRRGRGLARRHFGRRGAVELARRQPVGAAPGRRRARRLGGARPSAAPGAGLGLSAARGQAGGDRRRRGAASRRAGPLGRRGVHAGFRDVGRRQPARRQLRRRRARRRRAAARSRPGAAHHRRPLHPDIGRPQLDGDPRRWLTGQGRRPGRDRPRRDRRRRPARGEPRWLCPALRLRPPAPAHPCRRRARAQGAGRAGPRRPPPARRRRALLDPLPPRPGGGSGDHRRRSGRIAAHPRLDGLAVPLPRRPAGDRGEFVGRRRGGGASHAPARRLRGDAPRRHHRRLDLPAGGVTGAVRIERALLSVSDKTGLAELGRALAARGVELVSTGGTARALREAGLEVRDVADLTGFPEMMDGRVKTLHPMVHGGLLAVRDDPAHSEAMARHGIGAIDLVVVNLYPFAATVARGAGRDEIVENIDIGGPSMVRSAAKNHAWVAIVTDPADYPALIEALAEGGGETELPFRKYLAAKAFAATAAYDSTIAQWFAFGDQGQLFPDTLPLTLKRSSELRYGENPHQKAALYTPAGPHSRGIAQAEQVQGKELSYNNFN